MKTFEMWLHGKQGDSLNKLVEIADNASDAFAYWAVDFGTCLMRCETISGILEGKNVRIEADANCIFLHPLDRDAEIALEEIAERKLINVSETFSDKEDAA
jgi:hypothetical protein